MNYLLLFFAIVTTTIICMFYLKAPLEERGIEGNKSLILRLALGILLGVVISFLLQM